jgi:hypothetical protein
MAKKRVGVLFGMEDSFPWALIHAINDQSGGMVEAAPVELGHVMDDPQTSYDLVVDRISHEILFYRAWLKCAAASGTIIINNPFWSSADDRFLDNLIAKAAGVAAPRTVLLPHKSHPPNTTAASFRNMKFVDWEEVFSYLGFPLFLKPACGGGWRDVYRCDDRDQFFEAYDQTGDLTMMAQEAIDASAYFRCYVVGRHRVRIMQYDPSRAFHERYVREPVELDPKLAARVERDAVTLCQALGYDMNTVEFAVRDGVPYAIDFMNPSPDADPFSVGEENFRWVVENTAQVVIEKVQARQPFETTGSWPDLMARKVRAAPKRKKKRASASKSGRTRRTAGVAAKED